MEIILILSFLIVLNTFWFVAYYCKKKDENKQLQSLITEKVDLNETYDKEELRDEIEPKQQYAWIYGIAVCLNIWLIGAVCTHLWASHFFTDVTETDSRKALFGDSFGAVNALVSAFAFAGMIVAFILQRYELRLQRKELKAQRDEFSQQNKTLALQRFENTFFNMLEVQQQIVSDLSAEHIEKVTIMEDASPEVGGRIRKEDLIEHNISGRNLFLFAFEKSEHIVHLSNPDRTSKIEGLGQVMAKMGFSHYDSYYTSTYFDHYFRHFYRILKFVKQNEDWLPFKEQYKYTSMLRGTLSRYELVWLFYNGLSDNGCEKLKPLMEHYSILKNLRADLLTLCKDNLDKFVSAGITAQMLSDNNITGTDYEFALSDQKNTDKYYLSAFYSPDELQFGREKYNSWIKFCEGNGIVF